jgi:exopolysaccharide biosynthesis polyprenyl glycosylphosphotransferase
VKSSMKSIELFTMQKPDAPAQDGILAFLHRNEWSFYIISLFFNDLAMMSFAFWVAYYIRFELSLPIFQIDVVPSKSFYQMIVLVLLPLWLIVFPFLGLYNRDNLLGGTVEYAQVFKAATISLFVVIVAGFLEPAFIIARGWLLMAWILSFVFTSFGRFWLRRAVYWLRRKGFFLSKAVIVGANAEGIQLAQQLLTWTTSGLDLIGFIDKKCSIGEKVCGNLEVLGNLDDLDKVIKYHNVDELILASSAISSRDKLLDVFKQYGVDGDVNVRMSSGLYEIVTTGLTVKEFAYVPLVGVNKVRLTGVDRAIKLILDYGLAIPGVILISPVLLILAILVKLDSPGPVFHRRRVMGVNGKQFDALKFRTMYVNGDEIFIQRPELKMEYEKNHKLKNDPRITKLGAFLRKYSLDELPQIFNVLCNQMALVGPRMISPEEVSDYDRWGINLLTVKPGITGLWQVSGRSDIKYEERVQLDMYYIRNWSLWLDLQLLIRTIPVVIYGKGAY